ncbi:MAG: GNAT family N-acetyltransferase [Planctomycetota bacterium]|jgi:ribosomal protein S18 acetylase RimI-like enzyme
MPIRELGVEDHASVVHLWRRAGLSTVRPEGRDSPAEFARQLSSGHQRVLGLEEEGRLVGAVVATHDGRKGWINRLAVLPDARGEGRGSRLLSAAEEVLRSEGMPVLAALVEEENEPSLLLFAKAGYRVDRSVLYLSKRDLEDS